MNAALKLYEAPAAVTIDEAIANFCERLTEVYLAHLGPDHCMAVGLVITHEASPGKVYRRIAKVERFRHDNGANKAGDVLGRSATCFVKLEDGTIWKAASWKAPAKNFPRGNVYDLPERLHWSY